MKRKTETGAIFECDCCPARAVTEGDLPSGWREQFYETDLRMAHVCPGCQLQDIDVVQGDEDPKEGAADEPR